MFRIGSEMDRSNFAKTMADGALIGIAALTAVQREELEAKQNSSDTIDNDNQQLNLLINDELLKKALELANQEIVKATEAITENDDDLVHPTMGAEVLNLIDNETAVDIDEAAVEAASVDALEELEKIDNQKETTGEFPIIEEKTDTQNIDDKQELPVSPIFVVDKDNKEAQELAEEFFSLPIDKRRELTRETILNGLMKMREHAKSNNLHEKLAKALDETIHILPHGSGIGHAISTTKATSFTDVFVEGNDEKEATSDTVSVIENDEASIDAKNASIEKLLSDSIKKFNEDKKSFTAAFMAIGTKSTSLSEDNSWDLNNLDDEKLLILASIDLAPKDDNEDNNDNEAMIHIDTHAMLIDSNDNENDESASTENELNAILQGGFNIEKIDDENSAFNGLLGISSGSSMIGYIDTEAFDAGRISSKQQKD